MGNALAIRFTTTANIINFLKIFSPLYKVFILKIAKLLFSSQTHFHIIKVLHDFLCQGKKIGYAVKFSPEKINDTSSRFL
jgi:hypothetical protein